ncbi:MAG: IS200/IS605 family transposase [Myxococcales bacterium]|nr:IS200/IS605 family transposase [Myxococcales bacterium]
MSHSNGRILLHTNWATHRREPPLTVDVEPLVQKAIRRQCAVHTIPLLAVGVADDHVHVLIELPAQMSIATALRLIKGGSSGAIAEALERRGLWQRGYYARGVSEASVKAVLEYVLNQRANHASKRTIDAKER